MACISVGDTRATAVLEMALERRPIAYLGAPAELIEQHRHWLSPWFLEPGDTWSLNFQTWVLDIDGRIVVVDPCTGNGRPHPWPQFDMLDTPFIERFEAAGTRTEDVDFVFCTHLHHDHCGWNTRLKDGRWTPTFPNARYIFLRREYERWIPGRADYRAVAYNEGVYERSILPIVDAGLADFVDAPAQLLPGLMIEPAHGHTLGHAMLHLRSNGEEAYFSGDCFHHPLQLTSPEIQFGDCDDVALAIEVRRRLVSLSIERDALIVPAHLPAPHCGKVRRGADGQALFDALAGLAATGR